MSEQRRKGLFVCAEGNEGAGKTTQVRAVAEALRARGIPTVTTREPGGTTIAEAIRAVVCQNFDEPLSANTTMLLMFAAREQHILNFILPKLEEGFVVITDRYIDAGYALQVVGDGADADLFGILQERALQLCTPDRTFVFQVSVDTSRERSKGAGRGGIERFDNMEDEHRARVNAAYNSLLIRPDYVGIDAEAPAEVTTELLTGYIATLYNTRGETP